LSENKPIGEIVEVKDSAEVIVELYDENLSLLKDNLFRSENNGISTIYICEKLYKEPVDRERRVVALNLPYEEIIKKYPQEKFLIKDYALLYIAGSISGEKFFSSVQISNIGAHTRVYPFTKDEYKFFINNKDALLSLLLSIYNNRNIVPAMKPILNSFFEIDDSIEFITSLYKAVTTVFRNDYMLIRDIVSSFPR
jgi:hypothetical protein